MEEDENDEEDEAPIPESTMSKNMYAIPYFDLLNINIPDVS